ncbi:MAG: hypothetical protein H6667_20140 [Ardenticatenaceae bacterium]|nr:hypothetical protein [Ardenticatenaceae bacterium]MCB9445984.1 hypothetical protein [Ardenticatenaceae bacterium]
MTKTEIEIRSWDRFITRNFVIQPDLLGKQHTFSYENYKIQIKLPDLGKLDRGKGYDEVISVGSLRTVNKGPIDYNVLKVDVTVRRATRIQIRSEVLTTNPNARELFSDDEQENLNRIAFRYGEIAEKAFDYWIRVVRWKTNLSIFGRYEWQDNRTGWSTRLEDIASEKTIWIGPGIGHIRSVKAITLEEWNEIESVLSQGIDSPIYHDLKHDGKVHLMSGDLYRAVVDLAVACETYMRFSFLKKLSQELNPTLLTFIEEANISQYLNKFFPSILDDYDKKRFKEIKSDLHKLFNSRNKVVHMGEIHGLTEATCRKFAEVTDELLSIKPK